jgi:hypothetical protein
MSYSEQEMLPTESEFDFSDDSTVETIEADWDIISADVNHVESDRGRGVQHVITFQNADVLPFPITVRQFVSYEYKNGGDNAWVKRSRGVLKNIVKAATGETSGSLDALVGRTVRATTRDDGQGFYTLGKFRPSSN